MKLFEDPTEKAEEDLQKKQYKDLLEAKRSHIEAKNKYRNLSRCLNALRMEEEEQTLISHATERGLRQEEKIEREESLARELDQLKRNEIRDKKLRQHLRENSHELRELESQLRAAYVNKELLAQIAEKESIKMQDKMQDKEAHETLRKVWYDHEQYRTDTLQKEIVEKARYKEELQNQIVSREKFKRFEYEEFLKEKMLLDDIAQRLHDEDVRAIKEKMIKMKKTQEEIAGFVAAQQVWKEKQKRELENENRRIQEYLLSKAMTSQKAKQEQERIEACKQRISDDIARKLYEEKRQRREREEIIAKLQEEEMKEEIDKKYQLELAKQQRQKLEVLTSLAEQLEQRKEEARQRQLEDLEYREQLIAKIAEDERVEQLSNERKRRKMIEIRKEVEKTILLHRQRKAEEIQRQQKLIEMEKLEEEERLRRVREERIRMLKEHAANLIGYLPHGIIQPDDLPYLGSEFEEIKFSECADKKK